MTSSAATITATATAIDPPPVVDPVAVLESLRRRGFAIRPTPSGAGLAVDPASRLSAGDREAIRTHRAAIIAILREEGEQVGRWLFAADAFFAASGVPAADPAVAAAVAAVWSAMLSRDLATVRFAVMEFRYAVREAMRAKLVKAREVRKPC